jgi:hypothetical protein
MHLRATQPPPAPAVTPAAKPDTACPRGLEQLEQLALLPAHRALGLDTRGMPCAVPESSAEHLLLRQHELDTSQIAFTRILQQAGLHPVVSRHPTAGEVASSLVQVAARDVASPIPHEVCLQIAEDVRHDMKKNRTLADPLHQLALDLHRCPYTLEGRPEKRIEAFKAFAAARTPEQRAFVAQAQQTLLTRVERHFCLGDAFHRGGVILRYSSDEKEELQPDTRYHLTLQAAPGPVGQAGTVGILIQHYRPLVHAHPYATHHAALPDVRALAAPSQWHTNLTLTCSPQGEVSVSGYQTLRIVHPEPSVAALAPLVRACPPSLAQLVACLRQHQRCVEESVVSCDDVIAALSTHTGLSQEQTSTRLIAAIAPLQEGLITAPDYVSRLPENVADLLQRQRIEALVRIASPHAVGQMLHTEAQSRAGLRRTALRPCAEAAAPLMPVQTALAGSGLPWNPASLTAAPAWPDPLKLPSHLRLSTHTSPAGARQLHDLAAVLLDLHLAASQRDPHALARYLVTPTHQSPAAPLDDLLGLARRMEDIAGVATVLGADLVRFALQELHAWTEDTRNRTGSDSTETLTLIRTLIMPRSNALDTLTERIPGTGHWSHVRQAYCVLLCALLYRNAPKAGLLELDTVADLDTRLACLRSAAERQAWPALAAVLPTRRRRYWTTPGVDRPAPCSYQHDSRERYLKTALDSLNVLLARQAGRDH